MKFSIYDPDAMSTSDSISEAVCNTARAVGSALAQKKYAVVGGAACVLLGSRRVTQDVDLVVPKGKTVETRNTLRNADGFTVEPGTAHTYYQSAVPIAIEILTPPLLFREKFDSDTPTIVVQGVNILKPALILNAKCRSVLNRSADEKKTTDAMDIQFLLEYLAETGPRPTAAEVPIASGQFFEWFTEKYGREDAWTRAGYDVDKGLF